MFRQDRANPNTSVVDWRGNRSTAKGWPGTLVSTWMNGGLFGGATPLVAFGGIITQYEDGGTTYRVHTFRGTGKFFVSAGAADVDLLIVAGGGGSGIAGGGAGGVRHKTGVAVSAGTYTITVGAGGEGGIWSGKPQASDGANTSALGFTATGGGKGGMYTGSSFNVGGNGGSGGGTHYSGASSSGNAGGYSPVEGYGGSVNGAGGGASAAGSAAVGGAGLAGMLGITATTRTYGGGGAYKGGSITEGGAGGGGEGGRHTGFAGTPNTGGGGGGKNVGDATPTEWGGAGIVIIRYEAAV